VLIGKRLSQPAAAPAAAPLPAGAVGRARS